MRLTRQEVGRHGEEYAQRLLEANGFRLVDVNVRFGRQGEIDIIAWDREVLCFVEVKTRTIRATSNASPSEVADIAPAEAVTPAKQRQIAALAQQYAVRCGFADADDGPPFRFDVVAIEMNGRGKVCRAELCRGAFFAPDDAEF